MIALVWASPEASPRTHGPGSRQTGPTGSMLSTLTRLTLDTRAWPLPLGPPLKPDGSWNKSIGRRARKMSRGSSN